MHTFSTLTLDEAHLILDAAQKKAEELGVPEVLCVADNAGYPIALRRLDGGKVTLVTLPRILGHIFNPVSFYFCHDRHGAPLAAIAEVTNTFRESKPFLLGPDRLVPPGTDLNLGEAGYLPPELTDPARRRRWIWRKAGATPAIRSYADYLAATIGADHVMPRRRGAGGRAGTAPRAACPTGRPGTPDAGAGGTWEWWPFPTSIDRA